MIIGGQSGSLLRRRFTSPHSSRNASGTEWSLPSTLYCFNISAASSILRCWVVIPSIKNNLFFTKTNVCVVWERLGCNVGMLVIGGIAAPLVVIWVWVVQETSHRRCSSGLKSTERRRVQWTIPPWQLLVWVCLWRWRTTSVGCANRMIPAMSS